MKRERDSNAFVRAAAISALALALGGCLSVANLTSGVQRGGEESHTEIYGGVRMDCMCVHEAFTSSSLSSELRAFEAVAATIDLPLSLALDTLTLPITVPIVMLRKPDEPAVPPPLVRAFAAHGAAVRGVLFSPDGRTLASCGDDKTIKLWDVASGRELATILDASASRLAFSPDGKRLLSASFDSVRLWDAETGSELRTFLASGTRSSPGHHWLVGAAAFGGEGRTIVSLRFETGDPGTDWRDRQGYDPMVTSWDAGSGAETGSFSWHTDSLWGAEFSANGATLATSEGNGKIRLTDVASGAEQGTLAGRIAGSFRIMRFGPDGKTLAYPGGQSDLDLWDLQAREKRFAIPAGNLGIGLASFRPDGRVLATSHGKTIRFWDVATGEELRRFMEASDWDGCLAFSPDGRTLALGKSDGTIKLWDMKDWLDARP